MATVTGLTAERMLEIEAESIVGGAVDGSGHLILTKHDATEIDAGSVIGPQGPPFTNGVDTLTDQNVGGNKTYTGITRFKAGAPVTESDAMVRVLGGDQTAPLSDPQHGIAVLLYDEAVDTGIIYAAVNVKRHARPASDIKPWGVVVELVNESPNGTATGLYSTVRSSRGGSAWGAALEVWDQYDPGTGMIQGNSAIVGLESMVQHRGTGTAHGVTVIAGGTTPGTRGIWVQPGGPTNGSAGWSIGVDVEIGPVDNATVGLRLRGSQQGAPPAWAGYYLQCLHPTTGIQNIAIRNDGLLTLGQNERTKLSPTVMEVSNETLATAAGLVKLSRQGVNKAQLGLDGTDKYSVFNGSGTVLLTVTDVIADGGTALLLRRNLGGVQTLQPVTVGAADSGGAGFKLLRIPN